MLEPSRVKRLAVAAAATVCVTVGIAAVAGSDTLAGGGCGDQPYPAPERATKARGVWVADADGTGERLVLSAGDHAAFAWSPGGRQIAGVTTGGDGEPAKLTIVNSDGTGPRELPGAAATGSPYAGVQDLAWSPDGTQLSFSVMNDGNNRQVFDHYVVNVDGTGRRLVAAGTESINTNQSPDGAAFAFTGLQDGQVYVTGPGRSDPLQVTDDNGLRNQSLDWSPDGLRLAVEAFPDTNSLVTSSRLDIVDVDGGARQTIAARDGRFFSHPVWSPDGRWIAFDNYPHEDWGWVSVVRPDGSDRHNLTPKRFDIVLHEIAWSPNSDRLAFREGDGITVANLEGGGRRCLARGLDATQPAWSPDGASIAYVRG